MHTQSALIFTRFFVYLHDFALEEVLFALVLPLDALLFALPDCAFALVEPLLCALDCVFACVLFCSLDSFMFLIFFSPYLLSKGKGISTYPCFALHSGQTFHASFVAAR